MGYTEDSMFQQWQKMISGNPVDPAQVRSEILKSWVDCLDKGIDAYK
jgi:hypothetical protein